MIFSFMLGEVRVEGALEKPSVVRPVLVEETEIQ